MNDSLHPSPLETRQVIESFAKTRGIAATLALFSEVLKNLVYDRLKDINSTPTEELAFIIGQASWIEYSARVIAKHELERSVSG